MPGNAPTEAPISLGTTVGGPTVRNLMITALVNGVLTPVLMQVVSMANADGTLIDMSLGPRIDVMTVALQELLREQLITNDLLAQGLNISVDLEKEYRADRRYLPASEMSSLT